MKTITTHHESYQPKQGFGARLLFYAFLLSIIGLSKAFAQAPSAPVATTGSFASTSSCNMSWDTLFYANWNSVNTATAYYLDVSTDATFSSFYSGINNHPIGNMTTYAVWGIWSSGAVYYYRVRAENGNGTSTNSNTMAVNMDDLKPVAMATPSYQTMCSGNNVNISLASSYPNTVYNWTPSQSGVTGATSGSGIVIQDQLSTTGLNSGYAHYMITPLANGCSGDPVVCTVAVNSCLPGLGASFASPQNGATINNRCDLQFCMDWDSIGQHLILDTALNIVASINVQQSPSDTICSSIDQYYTNTIPAGNNTFYLVANGIFYDTVTVNVTAPINPLQNQVIITQTAQPNGVYDFTVSGLSNSETYTVVLQNNYNQQNDTLLVSNATTATISHQYPYNGYFFGSIMIHADCYGIIYQDSVTVNVTNSACSSYIAVDGYSYFYDISTCDSDSILLLGGVQYANLIPLDSSLVTINWGDGNTETVQMSHGNGVSGFYSLSMYGHSYNSPGTYTAFVTVSNANVCYVDTLIHSITIGSTTCGSLYGTIFSDVNSNCTLNSGTDVGLGNLLITATDNSNNVYYAWTDFNGNYAFNTLPNGTYVVDLAYLNSGYSITCSGSFPQTVTINNNSVIADCPVTCSGAFDAAITGISIWSALYPGQPEMILPHVGILNGGCNSTVVAGQVKIVLDACTQYTSPSTYSGAGAPDAIITASTGDTLVWNVADINNIGNFSYYDYAINILMCTTAQVGDSACITMIVEPLTGDADPSNNTYTRCFEIGVSYDPNNKEVQPKGVEAAGFIPADQPSLTYTLNFQNTGTAKAFNIYVMDTIDTDLDINSIEILSASHKLQVYTLPNRSVKFMFADIMLIDSTHDEPNSHGYVTFKIKVNAGLTPGTEIENTGHIYFDYNDPIVTNTTLNTIEFPSSVNAIGKSTVVKVFPNPAKESVTVVSNSNSTGVITITDLLGKTVKEVTTTNEKTVVNTADLQSGVYFIKLTQNNVSKTEKIMIAK